MAGQELDVGIDEAKAKIWIEDVKHEVAEVRVILTKVSNANQSVAGEDDDIFKIFDQICATTHDVWENMCSTFEKANEAVTGVVESIGKAGQAAADKVQEFLDNFKR